MNFGDMQVNNINSSHHSSQAYSAFCLYGNTGKGKLNESTIFNCSSPNAGPIFYLVILMLIVAFLKETNHIMRLFVMVKIFLINVVLLKI